MKWIRSFIRLLEVFASFAMRKVVSILMLFLLNCSKCPAKQNKMQTDPMPLASILSHALALFQWISIPNMHYLSHQKEFNTHTQKKIAFQHFSLHLQKLAHQTLLLVMLFESSYGLWCDFIMYEQNTFEFSFYLQMKSVPYKIFHIECAVWVCVCCTANDCIKFDAKWHLSHQFFWCPLPCAMHRHTIENAIKCCRRRFLLMFLPSSFHSVALCAAPRSNKPWTAMRIMSF